MGQEGASKRVAAIDEMARVWWSSANCKSESRTLGSEWQTNHCDKDSDDSFSIGYMLSTDLSLQFRAHSLLSVWSGGHVLPLTSLVILVDSSPKTWLAHGKVRMVTDPISQAYFTNQVKWEAPRDRNSHSDKCVHISPLMSPAPTL